MKKYQTLIMRRDPVPVPNPSQLTAWRKLWDILLLDDEPPVPPPPRPQPPTPPARRAPRPAPYSKESA
jgi:hypothetical protein